MRLEDQICTPDQALNLLDLGVYNNEACFWYNPATATTKFSWGMGYPWIAQYTAAELEILLPSRSERSLLQGYVQLTEDIDAGGVRSWTAAWLSTVKHQVVEECQAPTAAWARADLLIALLGSGIQNANQVNRRYRYFCEQAAKRY